MSKTELPKTISELQSSLLKKQYSCVELVDAYLENIKNLNPKFNAILTVSEDKAYEDAKRADRFIKDNGEKIFETHPLLGATVIHKDLFMTKGTKTTAGSNVLKDYIPPYSATVVTKLQDVGAICLGKSNCDAWGHGSSGENSDFGATKNPWNIDYISGGSSSGSAAAVCANMATIATGTDTGGSIRMPASFCGVVGFKPTYGAVSRYGVISMASSLDTVGHFARSVDDIEKVFNVTKGFDKLDSNSHPTSPHLASRGRKFKIGIPKEYFLNGLSAEVSKRIHEAILVFKKAGVEFVEVSLPHTKYAISAYYIIQPAEVSSNLARFDGVRFGNDRNSFGREAKRRIMLGTYVLSSGYYDAYYKKAQEVREILTHEFNDVFSKVDALIAPVSPTSAFKIGEKVSDPLSMYLADIFTVSANLVGIPAIALPAGFSKGGLPIGFQLMAKRFDDQVLFNIGKMYEGAINI